MPHDWVILLIALPLLTSIVTLALTGRRRTQQAIGLVAVVGNLAVSLWGLVTVMAGDGQILVSQMGAWPSPFGISVVLDPLAAILVTVSAAVTAAVFLYCTEQLPSSLLGGFFHPLFHLLTLGVQWSFLTADLFNLFVAFEILLMASYVLLVNGTTRAQMRHAYKYILLNLFGSMMFVTTAGLIYGQTGTLNIADLARLSQAGQLPPGSTPVFALLLLSFGLKTAIFPLWFWLPESYPTLHPAIGGLFAGLLTKVGAYVLIRSFVLMLGTPDGAVALALAPLLLVSAGVTMFVGVLGAVSMHGVRSILSIHIISQIGYMLLGIALAITAGISDEHRVLALAGAIFFVMHNMVVKSSLFLCGGLMKTHAGSDDLERIGGLARRAPWLAALFLVAALSLAGLPPLSGFFGKFVLIRGTFESSRWILGGLAIATSLLTLLSMLKIWSYGFWSEPRGLHVVNPQVTPRVRVGMAATAALVLLALSMGLAAQPWFDATVKAARLVVHPDRYIQAVLIDANQRTLDDNRVAIADDPAVADPATPEARP